MPNGKEEIVGGDGKFKKWALLQNVLYVPAFICNLILAYQLANNRNWIITYSANFCLIQDLTSKMLIGEAEERSRCTI